MVNIYSQGLIYKIIGGEEIYIGSTTFTKEERFKHHIKDYKQWLNGKPKYVSSFELFGKYGIDNCKIEIIESYSCNSKKELRDREGYHQKSNICVNMIIAGRTQKDWYQDNKEQIIENSAKYYQDNKKEILEYQKEHYEKNKKELLEYQKEYSLKNKEQIIENSAKYYQDNKKEILEKHKQKFDCECGSTLRQGDKSTHFKTLKHLAYLEKNI